LFVVVVVVNVFVAKKGIVRAEGSKRAVVDLSKSQKHDYRPCKGGYARVDGRERNE
jgi:hypothetical protein